MRDADPPGVCPGKRPKWRDTQGWDFPCPACCGVSLTAMSVAGHAKRGRLVYKTGHLMSVSSAPSLYQLRTPGPQLWAKARAQRATTPCPHSRRRQRQRSYEMPWWRQNFVSGKFTVLSESKWDGPCRIPGGSGLSFQPVWEAAAVLVLPAAPIPSQEPPKPWPSLWWRKTVQVILLNHAGMMSLSLNDNVPASP